MDEEEFIQLNKFGSYRISEFDKEHISIECLDYEEVVLVLNRVEAQQFITNMYNAINKLS